jgi:type IV pilus assembly protein PilO
MNNIFEEVLERPTQQKLGILFGAIFVTFLIIWANILSPKSVDYGDLSEKVEALKLEIQKEKRLAMNRQKFEQEVAELDLKLESALKELPDSSEIPELLASVSSVAKEAGLEVESFKVNLEQTADFYSKFPVEVSVYGSFHQVASFLDAVSDLSRIVNISQLEIINPSVASGSANLTVNCIATTFRYISPEEQEKLKEQPAANKRR